ncbi:hypothetical protein KR093_008719, partial [Drosophila rubida]
INRTIISVVSKLSYEDPTKWYKTVPHVQRAINSFVQSSTKRTSFELMFGVKMQNKVGENLFSILREEIVETFDKERNQLRQEAKRNIEKAQADYKRHFDKKRKPDFGYKEGDLVAVKRKQFIAGRKLESAFLGPYEK